MIITNGPPWRKLGLTSTDCATNLGRTLSFVYIKDILKNTIPPRNCRALSSISTRLKLGPGLFPRPNLTSREDTCDAIGQIVARSNGTLHRLACTTLASRFKVILTFFELQERALVQGHSPRDSPTVWHLLVSFNLPPVPHEITITRLFCENNVYHET